MLSFLKHFIRYHIDRKRLFHTVLIVMFAAGSIILYWFALKETRVTLSEEFFHREQVIARSGSLSISNFIELLGNSVAWMGEHFSEDGAVGNIQLDTNNFMNHWRETPVAGVLLTDSEGKVVAQANRVGSLDFSTSVSDLPSFRWAKTARIGEYFVGNPGVGKLGFAKGKIIVRVASPVIVKGDFQGMFAAAVILSDLTDVYVSPIKISDDTRIFLFDQNGIILSSMARDLVGTNYFDFLSKYSYPDLENIVSKLKSAMISTESEGKLDINLPDSLNQRSVSEFLVAYSKVKVGDNNWLLAIKSPKSDSDVYFWRVKDIIYSALVFTLALVVVFSITNLQAEKHRRKEDST